MSDPTPKHRWFRWSLRTLFVVVTLVCVWLGYHVNWIRQRHAVLSRPYIATNVAGEKGAPLSLASAPFPLRLFGEPGCNMVHLGFVDDERASRRPTDDEMGTSLLNAAERAEIERVRRLFPEAVAVDGSVMSQREAQDLVLEESELRYE